MNSVYGCVRLQQPLLYPIWSMKQCKLEFGKQTTDDINDLIWFWDGQERERGRGDNGRVIGKLIYAGPEMINACCA